MKRGSGDKDQETGVLRGGGGAGVDTPVYIRYILQKLTPMKLLIVCQYLSTTKNTLSLQTKESFIDSLVSKMGAVVTQENSVEH